ncbi:hypothetical protein [Desulfonatronovibrio magnus]|uniref:hypothetical protein n=1 Tax=Desulfonatronovibrio magnus TaxID=698827 RepID=UPI0005EB3889|nr:hypothetical protein [Desulfonatronovibrio magnus]
MEEKIEAKVADIIERVDSIHFLISSDLTAQINGAITQMYKAITELQLEYKDLHARLAHLEKELGATPAANPVLVDLDLKAMQVKLEKPEPVLQHATIEFVKASISDGKPDKLSVVQWITAERERNPSVSYGELAEMLDNAGIPTLSGKVGWNRGTIRNLVVK